MSKYFRSVDHASSCSISSAPIGDQLLPAQQVIDVPGDVALRIGDAGEIAAGIRFRRRCAW
jgi:hypothetical protein